MKSSIYFILTLLFLSLYGQSQTNDRIKQKSKENREKRNNSNSSDSWDDDIDLSMDDVDAEACIDGCVGCFDGLGLIFEMFEAMAEKGDEIKLRKDSIPRISTIELGANFNLIPSDHFVIIPKIQFNGGLLTTTARMYNNKEERLEGSDTYGTFDWQILQFNLIVDKVINLRVGSGIMLENHSSEIFNEHSFDMEFHSKNDFKFLFECRFAMDYKTETMVRSELNGAFYYPMFRNDDVIIHATLNGITQKYYEEVHVWSIGFGVSFRFQ